GQYAAQIGNDHIGLLRKTDIRRKRLDALHAISKSVCASSLLRNGNGAARLDSIDFTGAVLACKEAEYPGPGANVEYSRTGRYGTLQSTRVCTHAPLVRYHPPECCNVIHRSYTRTLR